MRRFGRRPPSRYSEDLRTSPPKEQTEGSESASVDCMIQATGDSNLVVKVATHAPDNEDSLAKARWLLRRLNLRPSVDEVGDIGCGSSLDADTAHISSDLISTDFLGHNWIRELHIGALLRPR